jgi:4-hydroxy-3-methylbut-2-enyl diphosphate reductase
VSLLEKLVALLRGLPILLPAKTASLILIAWSQQMPAPSKRLLTVNPRGFCAGVERAIEVVDQLLTQHGAPLYVRKEIVHNKAVVEDFKERGVIFVDELDEIPDHQTVVFSAHGIAPAVREEAKTRGLRAVDATCPLVTKVHQEVVNHVKAGHHMVLIGHAGHDEVMGTMGEAPGEITLVTNIEDVARLKFPAESVVACSTQTTLSVDETREIVAALRVRYVNLVEPSKSDICYATQNRQDAVKALLEEGITHLLVVGSESSSNSRRLCEVAIHMGIPAYLIDGPQDIELSTLDGAGDIGLTAGASAPEYLVQEVVEYLGKAGWEPEELVTLTENVKFRLPLEL